MSMPNSESTRQRVLFVCLGNICRSPLAEGIFCRLVADRGLEDRFFVDSAGTAGYHAGEAPDHRSVEVAARRGVRLTSTARKATQRDMDAPGVVVAMDESNRRALERLQGRAGQAEIVLMRDYDPEDAGADVPDPYYGGPKGFDEVYEMLARSCEGLLDDLTGRGD